MKQKNDYKLLLFTNTKKKKEKYNSISLLPTLNFFELISVQSAVRVSLAEVIEKIDPHVTYLI